MKSYPYMAFAEYYGYYYTDDQYGRIRFLTKRTGSWVSSIVDSDQDGFCDEVKVANNGSFFCLTADGTEGLISYTSSNEGQTWTRHVCGITEQLNAVALVCAAGGVFGLWSDYQEAWYTSSDGIAWTKHAHDYSEGLPESVWLSQSNWIHVDTNGTIHAIVMRYDNIYYSYSKDFINWSDAVLIVAASAAESGSLICGNKDALIVAGLNWHDVGTSTLKGALSLDDGATWTAFEANLPALIGAGEFNGWVASGTAYLQGGLIDDTIYYTFAWLRTDLDVYNEWCTVSVYAEGVSLGSPAFQALPTTTAPTQTQWFAGSATDPTNDNGWIMWSGYSIVEDRDGEPYYGTHIRKVAELSPETLSLSNVYTLAGSTIYGLTYEYIEPASTLASRIPGGWVNVGCYREFSRGGFAYFF